MPDRQSPDDAFPPSGSDAAGPIEISGIVRRLKTPPSNPVSRARIRVEQEVPPSQRGPGWDRHWRELEAYLEVPGNWAVDPEKERDGGA